MGSAKDSIKEMMGKNIKYLGKALLDKKIKEVEDDYENSCNKVIDNWSDFKEEDVIRELNYCTEYFLLMKEGDTIKCDCGDKEIPLFFDGEKIVFKSGEASPSENDIPTQIKNHKKRCFGTCLLEEPSRHPGEKAAGGNDCEPFIVGTSWLDTYNNVKAGDLRTVLDKQSWLACKYMGRIMSVDAIESVDTSSMTEEEAFKMMLAWVRGEIYIPQVILDKITKIYANPSEEELEKLKYNGTKNFTDKFDVKIIAWTKFVNNLWETDDQKRNHLEIRPVLFKAICMKETELGVGTRFNGQINIAQSMGIGDGGLWHLSDINPYPNSFYTVDRDTGKMRSGVLAWKNKTGSNKGEVTDGHIQFTETNYFISQANKEGNILYDRSFQSSQADFFGEANVEDERDSIFSESIKMVATHSDYPANDPKDKRADLIETRKGEIIMVVYNQQSVDMSLYAGALELANHGTTERIATKNYNSGKNVEAYANRVEGYLKDMNSCFVN